MVSFVIISLLCWRASFVFAHEVVFTRGTRRATSYRETHTKPGDDEDSDGYRCTVYGTTDNPKYPWCPIGGDSGRCTVRGTTDTPLYPWCPEGVGEEDSTDDYAPDGEIGDDKYEYDDSKDCVAISDGSASTTDLEHSLYQIDLALEIDGDVTATLARLEDFLQEYIATDLAGCNDNQDRGVEIQNVVFDIVEDTKSGMFDCELIFLDGLVCKHISFLHILFRIMIFRALLCRLHKCGCVGGHLL